MKIPLQRLISRSTRLLVLWLFTALSAAQAQTLAVATDTSLAPAMATVARAFESGRSGVRITLSVGAPGALLAQMGRGTVFDVLAGIDTETAALGQQRRLLQPALRSDFAGNTLVLIVPGSLALPVQRLSDLARPEVARIAIGRGTVEPAGRHAREAINAQRLWPALQRKMLETDDVRQVLDLVAAGEVEAGFVYATDATAAGPRVRVVETLKTTSPPRYLAQVGTASPQPALAREFVDFLRSEPARVLWQRAGFSVP
jgi:molybdate transport system substrate-binding protein